MRIFRLALLFLVLSTPVIHAQIDATQQPSPARPRGERINFPPGETEIRIHDPRKLPEQLRTELEKSCGQHERRMKEVAVHIFKLDDDKPLPVIAVVPCEGISLRSRAYFFDRFWIPIPMSFPVIERSPGISATFKPGALRWDNRKKTMIAVEAWDLCPSKQIRYTYRPSMEFDRAGTMTWTLLTAERSERQCNDQPAEWDVFWQAPEIGR